MFVLLGLGLLVVGAELLVRGASGLARAMGLSPLVIGLTVVAYGTSAPEFAVSVKAGLAGQADIALGNVVGSNTFNVLLILGVSALILPLSVASQLVRLDVPVMVGVSALTAVFGADGAIGRWEGIVFVSGMVFYTVVLVRKGKREKTVLAAPSRADPSCSGPDNRSVVAVVLVIVGLGLLILGARWFVKGAVELAELLGVSQLLVGLTVVAAGTSLPELATSVVAAARGERDIAIGNVVGSNIFNILAVLGASAAVSGRVVVAPAALHFDIPVMTGVAIACLPIFFTGGRISRWEGVLFIGYYLVYVVYLVLKPLQHEALPVFNAVVLWFALPGTALGIGLSLLYAFRARKVCYDKGLR